MFHLHIVDNVNSVLSSLIFAHFALRCGHLRRYLLLSASSAPSNRPPFNIKNGSGKLNLPLRYHTDDNDDSSLRDTERGGNIHNINEAETENNENDDVRALQIAAAILRGDFHCHSSSDNEADVVESLPWVCRLEERKEAIQKYPFFQSPFAKAEHGLFSLHANNLKESGARNENAPYFHFILAAQPSTYDYLCDYYADKRSSHSPTSGFPLSRFVIFCVSGGNDDIRRTAFIAQKFVEGLVGAAGAMEGNMNKVNDDEEEGKLSENDNESNEEWVERVDGTLEVLSSQYGVDIFVLIT